MVLRYRMPPKYICKIPNDDKYTSMLDPLELVICGESFLVRFHLSRQHFIKRLLIRYRLMPAQIHPNT